MCTCWIPLEDGYRRRTCGAHIHHRPDMQTKFKLIEIAYSFRARTLMGRRKVIEGFEFRTIVFAMKR